MLSTYLDKRYKEFELELLLFPPPVAPWLSELAATPVVVDVTLAASAILLGVRSNCCLKVNGAL